MLHHMQNENNCLTVSSAKSHFLTRLVSNCTFIHTILSDSIIVLSVKNHLKQTIEKLIFSMSTRECCIWPTKKLVSSVGNIELLKQGVSLLRPLFAWGAQTSTNSNRATVEGGKGNVAT